jgi:uncharacterized protein (TIGR00299 family) protein
MSWLVFDCPSGISGDMSLGALVDLGVPLEEIQRLLATLPLSGWQLRAESTTRNSIAATRVHVEVENHEPVPEPGHEPAHEHSHEHGHEHAHEHAHDSRHAHEHAHPQPQATHRNLQDVITILRAGALPPRALAWAERVFDTLARAEASVHRQPVDDVHFHEVGAVDAIIDIAGTCIALDWLCTWQDIQHLRVSQLRVGRGQVQTDHGTMPVPAPAVLRLLEGFPVQWSTTDGERVTPTGAAILVALASPLGDAALKVRATGYGAGSKDFRDAPNVLRVLLADGPDVVQQAISPPVPAAAPARSPAAPAFSAPATSFAASGPALPAHVARGRVAVLRTTLDDMVPELFGHLMNRLFDTGALDVQYASVQMKKSRPATQVTVIARPADAETLAAVLLNETTTLGVRVAYEERFELGRRMAEVETPYGAIRVKVSLRPDGRSRPIPEYESVRTAAANAGVPIVDVYQAALRAAGESLP